MILVVTPNPAVDVTYRVAEQTVGVTQRVLEVTRRPGGKGVNVGRVLDGSGIATRAVLPLGGTAGRWVAEALDDLALAHDDVPVSGETRTTVTVVDGHAHPTMFGEPGPALTDAEWAAVTATVVRLLTTDSIDALIVAGSLPADADPRVVADWVSAARGRNVVSVVDCSGAALLAAADAGATVCKPNRDELLDATGTADERAGALALLARGAANVVVSRGSDGIAAHAPDAVVVVSAVAGVSGNPTGAGDAATAGLVSALVADRHVGDPLEAVVVDADALRSAAAHGAAAVLRPVAGEVDPEDVERFLAPTDTTHATATAPLTTHATATAPLLPHRAGATSATGAVPPVRTDHPTGSPA